MLKRVGVYSWAGPGTERILKTKYFNPKIDHYSLFHAYDFNYLKKLQQLFGVTDAWISYSWGFSEKKEAIDRHFTLSRLKNFQRLGIKTHAYLQGCNLVYEDFKMQDYWCRDEKNRLITYYKGRKVCCVNNPNFRAYFDEKLNTLCKYSFDGIYVDNIQMGQLGIPVPEPHLPFVFAGCRCNYCQEKFRSQYNAEIPVDFENDLKLTQRYLDFRVASLIDFVSHCSSVVHKHKKVFGTNSYDPKFNMKYVYGFDVFELQKYQDYILFENHALTQTEINNSYIDKLTLHKPVFVVSYRNGIGYEKQYTQADFDSIFSEAKHANFNPVIKGSEFTTNGIWHNLYLNNLSKPRTDIISKKEKQTVVQSNILRILQIKFIRNVAKSKYNQTYTLVMENRYIRPFMKLVYDLVLH